MTENEKKSFEDMVKESVVYIDPEEEELIQEYESNATEINSMYIQLEEAYNKIEENEAKLKEYIDCAYKAKELGEELSYYQTGIRELNTALVRWRENGRELEYNYNRKKEISEELSTKLLSHGYVYKLGIRSNEYNLYYSGYFWVKKELE